MIQFTLQTLWFYGLGCLGALIPRFLEGYYNRKKKDVKTKKFKKKNILWEGGYILIGGVISVILTPSNELHAVIFGATWESFILNYIKKLGEKNE